MHSLVSFNETPAKLQKERKTIFLGMEGCCRHVPMMRRLYKSYDIIAVDSSKPMLAYGKKAYKLKDEDLFCMTV